MENHLQHFKNPDFEQVRDLAPNKELLEQDLYWVDVREPDEYTGELKHISNSNLIPLGQLELKMDQLKNDKAIVFICRSGRRSAMACQMAAAYGFKNIYNLQGGMIAWNDLDLPVE